MKRKRRYLPLSLSECDFVYHFGILLCSMNWLGNGMVCQEQGLHRSSGVLSILTLVMLPQRDDQRGPYAVGTALCFLAVSCLVMAFEAMLFSIPMLLAEYVLLFASVPILRLVENYWQKRFCLARYDVVFLGRPFAFAIAGVWSLWYLIALAGVFGLVPTAVAFYAIPAAVILSGAMCFGLRTAAFPKNQSVVIVRSWIIGRETEYDLSHAVQFRGLSRKQKRRISELIARQRK